MLLFTFILILYNIINSQPIFSTPWSNENNKLKNNISTNISDVLAQFSKLSESSTGNISELKNQISKLSESSNVDINVVKNDTMPSVLKILEESIQDLKTSNENSIKEIQTQIDKINKSLVDVDSSNNKQELQKQIKLLDDKLKQEISSSNENTQAKLQKQIYIWLIIFNVYL